MSAVESVLTKPHFKFETPAAKTTYHAESKDNHQERIMHFSSVLEEKLKTCFITALKSYKLK